MSDGRRARIAAVKADLYAALKFLQESTRIYFSLCDIGPAFPDKVFLRPRPGAVFEGIAVMATKKTKVAEKQKPSATISVSKEDLQRLKGLAERTKATRAARGFKSATEFCLAAGVSKQYLGNIELGKIGSPAAMPMIKVARALNVSVDWLLTGEGLPTGDTLKILPKEFDTLRALREASPEERKVISMILRPYLQPPGKPTRRNKAG